MSTLFYDVEIKVRGKWINDGMVTGNSIHEALDKAAKHWSAWNSLRDIYRLRFVKKVMQSGKEEVG